MYSTGYCSVENNIFVVVVQGLVSVGCSQPDGGLCEGGAKARLLISGVA